MELEAEKGPRLHVQASGHCSSSSNMISRMALNDNKAGMEGLDKERINQIIYEASKDSKFFENERKKEEQLELRIKEQKLKMSKISQAQLLAAEREADRTLAIMEDERDLSHTIVHVDMDAFYAAVEMRDDPSLANKPMAVGGMGMLSTSNYLARRFGVRAAMPGFIGLKLCPDLVIVKPNFDKYSAVSKEIRHVLAQYDPDFLPMSLDEAYLDLKIHLQERLKSSPSSRMFILSENNNQMSRISAEENICKCDLNTVLRPTLICSSKFQDHDKSDEMLQNFLIKDSFCSELKVCDECKKTLPKFNCKVFGFSVEDAVLEIRSRIEQRTRLTASAGIAPNTMLAKVCSDKNKPNGQYLIKPDKEEIMNFIEALPIRKISGIGKVTEKLLGALGVVTCKDLFTHRAMLYHLFSNTSFQHFLRISAGIGSSCLDRFVLNILAAPVEPQGEMVKSYLLDTVFLTSTNHLTVATAVVQCLIKWGLDFQHVLTFNTDNAAYMRKAFKEVLKRLMPNCVHVTCMSHIMNLLGEAFRKPFTLTNKYVKATNAMFWNAGARKARYIRHLKLQDPLGHPKMPPNPIGTRDGERKSISTERTFSEISDPNVLHQKCQELCQNLSEDMKEEKTLGKTVTLKIKTVEFEVKTRSYTLAQYTNDETILHKAAQMLLQTEIDAAHSGLLRLRLMGVRMSKLCPEQGSQVSVIDMFKRMDKKEHEAQSSETASSASCQNQNQTSHDNFDNVYTDRSSYLNLEDMEDDDESDTFSKPLEYTCSNEPSDIKLFKENSTLSMNKSKHVSSSHGTGMLKFLKSDQNPENILQRDELKVETATSSVLDISKGSDKSGSFLSENGSEQMNFQSNNLSERIQGSLSETYTSPQESLQNSTQDEPSGSKSESGMISCPICKQQKLNWPLDQLNTHVDLCLSKQAVKNILQKDKLADQDPSTPKEKVVKRPASRNSSFLKDKKQRTQPSVITYFKS